LSNTKLGIERVAAADVIDIDFRMQEHPFLPVGIGVVWLSIMVGGLVLAYQEFGDSVSVIWFVVGIAVLSLFSFGMWRNQFYRDAWPGLLANTHALYLVDSQMGDRYLKIPWRHVMSCEAGIYSLNVRGLLFTIKKTELTGEDLSLLQQASFVANENEQSITIGIASGLQKRSKVIDGLRSINPRLRA